MNVLTRLLRSFALVAGFAMMASAAHAACSSPNAPEGSLNYNHTEQRFEVCDNSNSWQPLGGGASALVSLTDVSVANPAGRDYLRYDAGTSRWVNISESTVMSTTTMVNGWPDAIACMNSGTRTVLYADAMPYSGDGGYYYRPAYSSAANDHYLGFYANGTYATQTAMAGYDCLNKSIAALYAEGKAFNFIGNANTSGSALGDRITSGTLAMVANSATSYVSLSTNGSTWGYLSSAGSFLPAVTANKVSATSISGSIIQVGNTAASCTSGISGSIRYNAGSMEYCNGASWTSIASGAASAVSSTGAIQFNVNNQLAGDTDNLFWHNTNKRLGVGTATPGATVEISSSEALRLTKTGGTANNTYVSWLKDGVRQAYMGYGVPGSYFSINMENSNNLHIGGGSVGIGVTVPSTTLYVNGLIGGGFGSAGTAGVLDWDDISNARPGSGNTLLRGSTASNAPNPGNTAYFHPFSFEYSTKLGSGNLTQFAIPYSPAASLDQGMFMRGRTSGTWTGWYKFIVADPSGNAIVPNNLTAAAFLYSSDKRLKNNIQTLTGGLAKLGGLEPVTFSYISDTTHRQRLGLIAQDVEKAFPQAVVTGDDGYKKVDYPSLVPVLISAVKELKTANDEQRAERERLREIVDSNRMQQKTQVIEHGQMLEQLNELRTANDNLLRRIEALEARKASMR